MDTDAAKVPTWLDLYDWRERVVAMYRERTVALRSGEPPEVVLQRFRAAKDALFAGHPHSPLDSKGRAAFAGLRYFDYNPALRVEAALTPDEVEESIAASSSDAHAMPLRRAAHLDFTLAGTPARLFVYWIDVYGGGLFLPFRDATSSNETYGGGRYLFDTVKGSVFEQVDGSTTAMDATSLMGFAGGRVILDFNYAYNPSCAYDGHWICPLAPRENWLEVPIPAGERDYHE